MLPVPKGPFSRSCDCMAKPPRSRQWNAARAGMTHRSTGHETKRICYRWRWLCTHCNQRSLAQTLRHVSRHRHNFIRAESDLTWATFKDAPRQIRAPPRAASIEPDSIRLNRDTLYSRRCSSRRRPVTSHLMRQGSCRCWLKDHTHPRVTAVPTLRKEKSGHALLLLHPHFSPSGTQGVGSHRPARCVSQQRTGR